jgi:hypothetical protein
MTRDMDLVRELLLKLEALPLRPGDIDHVSGDDEELAIEGRSAVPAPHGPSPSPRRLRDG